MSNGLDIEDMANRTSNSMSIEKLLIDEEMTV